MGFLTPRLPTFDVDKWRTKPHLQRLRPLVVDWGENGFGTPSAIYLLYLVKITGYALGGLTVAAVTTRGLGGLGQLSTWWAEPIVLQKLVVWPLLYEILGLSVFDRPRVA